MHSHANAPAPLTAVPVTFAVFCGEGVVMWSGRNVPAFRSTLIPLSSGSLEVFVGVFVAEKSNWGAMHYVHPYLSLPQLRLLKQF